MVVVKGAEADTFHALVFHLTSEMHAERIAAIMVDWVNACFTKVLGQHDLLVRSSLTLPATAPQCCPEHRISACQACRTHPPRGHDRGRRPAVVCKAAAFNDVTPDRHIGFRFHGEISRETAEDLLRRNMVGGLFLVRQRAGYADSVQSVID